MNWVDVSEVRAGLLRDFESGLLLRSEYEELDAAAEDWQNQLRFEALSEAPVASEEVIRKDRLK